MTISKPVIKTQPQSRTVLPGGLLHLGVTLNDATGCTFQWSKNGVALKGETDDDLVIGGIGATDAGDYTVAVTSAGGRTFSNKATVTVGEAAPPVVVTPPPVITDPPPVETDPPVTTDPPPAATLAIIKQPYMLDGVLHIDATGADTWRWRLQAGNDMVDPPGLDNSQPTLAITTSGTYDCIVSKSGIAGERVSDRVAFTVQPPVVVPPPLDPPPVVTPPVVTPPAGAIVLPKITAGYPQEAFPSTPGSNVQAALDAQKSVRLARGSYSGNVTMKPGYRLYAMPDTDFNGTITLPDGLTDFVISGLRGATINVTGHVTGGLFRRLTNSQINVQAGATLDSNLFLGLHGTGLDILGADWMNNRVIFQRRQSRDASYGYDCVIRGKTRANNVNNVLVGRTFQGLYGGGIDMAQQDSLTFVGTDAEDGGAATVKAANSGVLRWMNMNGGQRLGTGTIGFQVGVDELQVIGGLLYADTGIAGTNLKRTLLAGARFWLQDGSNAPLSGLGTKLTEASPAAALAPLINPVRVGSPWERPALATPPDPMPGWATPPKGYTDSTAMIQAGINANGIYLLAAGTYYVDGTITLRPDQGVIGAGDGKTVIIATNKSRDIFAPNLGGNAGFVGTGKICLMDLTLYGGAYQLHFHNTGDQPSDTVLSHVTFRNAGVAAIGVDLIYGMDNNLFDALNFVNCAAGIKQTANPDNGVRHDGVEGWVDMSYIDKTMFHGCQFIGCTAGADMRGTRTDGRDAFVNCVFRNCGTPGKFGANNDGLYFANCDMIDSGLLQTQSPVHLAGVNFSGAGPFLTGDVIGEGLTFQGSGAAFVNPGKVILMNSRPGGMTLAGALLNCNDSAVGHLLFGSAFG